MAFQTANATQQWTKMEVKRANNFGHLNGKFLHQQISLNLNWYRNIWTFPRCYEWLILFLDNVAVKYTRYLVLACDQRTWKASVISLCVLARMGVITLTCLDVTDIRFLRFWYQKRRLELCITITFHGWNLQRRQGTIEPKCSHVPALSGEIVVCFLLLLFF